MKRIELMIIGAQKAGTTSLVRYLGEHPGLAGPLSVEFAWFTDERLQQEELGSYMQRCYPADLPPGVRLMAKMSNLCCSEQGLRALHEHNPECVLVMVMRDPVQRAYSAYRMACYDGWMTYDPRYFVDLLNGPDAREGRYPSFIRYGWYARYLRTVYGIFPKDQVVLLRFEELRKDPQRSCDAIFGRSGLDAVALKGVERVHNETRMPRSEWGSTLISWLRSERNPLKRAVRGVLPYQTYLGLSDRLQGLNRSASGFPPLASDVKILLADHYAPHDRDLATLTGIDISSWTSQRRPATPVE